MSAPPPSGPELRTAVKVYLEDTDAQGVVYHANYLKYFERGRTDYLDAHGVGLKAAQDQGLRFVVHAMTIQFHRAVGLGERLEVVTTVRRASAFRVVFDQRAVRAADAEPVASAKVDVVCIDREGELAEITSELMPLE